MNRTAKGFSAIEIIVVVVIVIIIGLLGWKAWETFSGQKTTETRQDQKAATPTDQAPTITNSADLDKAASALDATNIDDGETTQLDAQTAF